MHLLMDCRVRGMFNLLEAKRKFYKMMDGKDEHSTDSTLKDFIIREALQCLVNPFIYFPFVNFSISCEFIHGFDRLFSFLYYNNDGKLWQSQGELSL